MVGTSIAAYFIGWLLASLAAYAVGRRFSDLVTPPDKVVMTRIGVAAGAVWPLLVVGLIELSAVVLLAKGVSPFIQSGVAAMGAPNTLVGVIVAIIVLMPEAATAIRAALADRLQTSINLALGSGVASIGLTVPTVALIAWWTDTPLELGVSPGSAALLGLSFLMAMITYGLGRASLLSGVVHLILLAMWLVFLITP